MRLPLQRRADATGIAVHAVVIVALVTHFNLTSLLKYRCRNRRRARRPLHPCTSIFQLADQLDVALCL